MADTPNIKRNERLFEAMLKIAAEEAVSEEMASLPNFDELENIPNPSAEFDKRIKKIISHNERSLKRKRAIGTMRTFTNIAASVCILFIVGTIAFIGFSSTGLFFNNDSDVPVFPEAVPFEGLRIGLEDFEFYDENVFLPYGFEHIATQYFDNMTTFIHMNDVGEQITINRHVGTELETKIQELSDLAYMEHSTTYVSWHEVHIFESSVIESSNILMWEYGYDLIEVVAHISIEELLLIAENLISQ